MVRETFLLRIALRALGEAIWSNDTWYGGSAILDPVITVHLTGSSSRLQPGPERLRPGLGRSGPVRDLGRGPHTAPRTSTSPPGCGRRSASLRTSRETWFRVEAGGFEVRTVGAGGRFERKVELPDEWVRGFLQLQAAMALPGTRLTARAVDVLAAQRFLQYTRARVSPRALRYEFEPGQDAQLVLEPWEHVVRLKAAEHNYTQRRVIRTWGRRRLKLIAPLLPFADTVEIYLKGRALPSFYVVHCQGSLSRWDCPAGRPRAGPARGASICSRILAAKTRPCWTRPLRLLRDRVTSSVAQVAAELKQTPEMANRLWPGCAGKGWAIYDVERRHFRHRELFEQPIDEARLYPPDERRLAAERMVGSCQVKPEACQPRARRGRSVG